MLERLHAARRRSSACWDAARRARRGRHLSTATEHDAQLQYAGPILPLAGTWTLDSFSEHLATLPLFEAEPAQHAYVDYRRWGFESAALDLALRQAGTSLGEAVGREPRPVSLRRVRASRRAAGDSSGSTSWLELYPDLRFKLDANEDWTDELSQELAATRRVDSIDFKGHYRGTVVDHGADPALYRRVVEGLPEASGSRIRASTTRRGRCSSRIATAGHVGRDHPLGRGHRGARLAAAHREREAVAVRIGGEALRRLRLLRGARDRRVRRRPVRARASVAGTSSTWPRCTIPTTPNDVAPRRFNLRSTERASREPAHRHASRDRLSRPLGRESRPTRRRRAARSPGSKK